jgi:uncharacterized protein
MNAVDLVGLHVEATSGAPLVLLREHDAPHRVVPIFIGAPEAAAIALALSGATPDRPLTHDLMVDLVRSLDAHIDSVEVTEVRGGAFVAELALSGPAGDRRLDTRPSDGIALAVRVGAPLFVSDAVLEEAAAVISITADEDGGDGDSSPQLATTAMDDAAIDQAVAEFRAFLDDVDDEDLAALSGPATPGDPEDEEPGQPEE